MVNRFFFLACAVIFCIGIVVGSIGKDRLDTIYARYFFDKITNSETRVTTNRGSSLTNPLLECRELPEQMLIGQRVKIENSIEGLISEYKSRGDLEEAAVYYRDLNNGPWFGIHEEMKFTPASLLKLPLAISYYWQAEIDPSILNSEIQFQKGATELENQPYGPEHTLENGKLYSVQDLISLMLIESSNEASLVLVELAGEDLLKGVYRDFGFEPPALGKDYSIDVHTYGSFFRILYNSTYLDRVSSEQILKILTQSSFNEGISGGVPKSVVVSHKFGSRENSDESRSKQLHDCGIVYADSPYILCVMTRGSDFAMLSNFIKDVSALTYNSVTASI